MNLTPPEISLRRNVRAFLLNATLEELQEELAISIEHGDRLRARFVEEMIQEEETNREPVGKP